MAVRTTRADVDAALAGTPNVRTTRVDADTLIAPATVTVRTTRADVDVLIVVEAAAVEGSFTANAVLKRTQTGSLTADAVLKRTQTSSLTADAVLRQIQASSLTADAILARTTTASFIADAVLKRTQTGSLTADAVISITTGTGSGSFTADAVLKRIQSGSFTADAVLRTTASTTFPADAVIRRPMADSLFVDAVLRQIQASSLSADAVLRQTPSGSFSADAVLKRTQSSSFSADAVLLRTQPASLSADAVLKRTQTGSLTADAVFRRTQTSSLSADAVLKRTQTGSLTADAVLMPIFTADAIALKTQVGFLTASAVIYDPGVIRQRDAIPIPHRIVIGYDGTDITADVQLREATFISLVNGAVGSCQFFVKDEDHSKSFITGKELTLDIDGHRLWGGYLMRVRKTFFFPAQDTTSAASVVRGWQMEGVDYNVLFQKRVIFSATHPTTRIDWTYPADTYDDTIIKDIFDNYLDLSGLGLSRSGVTRIDKAILDVAGANHKGTVASAGHTWGQMMQNIARATGAVFYISPKKVLSYVDVDTEDSVWVLADQPTGTWDIGYRELEIPFNAANLVNDMLVWGAALGSNRIVFSRTTNTASQTAHGRWQSGLYSQTLYRQSNVNKVADSYVYGTPQSKRGGKDDQVAFIGSVFEPVFIAGQKIRCISAIYGYDDVIPIRRTEITFPTKPSEPNTVYPKLRMTNSHEIDPAWSFFEIPGLRFGIDIDMDRPGIAMPGLGECVCGMYDSFTRTIASDWGLADAGPPWEPVSPSGTPPVFSVNGSEGVITFGTTPATGSRAYRILNPRPFAVPFEVQFRMHFTAWPSDSFSNFSFSFGVTGSVILTFFANGTVEFNNPVGSFTQSETYWVKVREETNTGQVKWWRDGWAEPDWLASYAHGDATEGMLQFRLSKVSASGNPFTAYIDSITAWQGTLVPGAPLVEINRCTEDRFDDFNRTVIDDWGTSDAGFPWRNYSYPPEAVGVVDGEGFLKGLGGTADWNFEIDSVGTPWQQDTWQLYARMRIDTPAVEGEQAGIAIQLGSLSLGLSIKNALGGGILLQWPSMVDAWLDKTDWETGIYLWRIEVDQNVMQFELWREGGSGAAEIVYQNAAWEWRDDTKLIISGGTAFANTIISFDYLNFYYAGKPCPDAFLLPGAAPSAGYVCESPTTADNRHFQLENAFIRGSSQVFMQGTRQRNPTDYTENPTGGEIIFANTLTIPEGDSVYVCYTANGSII